MSVDQLRAHAREIFRAGVAAVDPRAAVRRHLSREGRGLALRLASGERRVVAAADPGRVLVLGAGKAAAGMAVATEEVLGDLPLEGLVVTKDGHGAATRRVAVREAAHPVPDVRGAAANRELLELARGAGPGDVVLVLLSGGGSALLPLPAPGLELEDVRALTSLLLAAGAPIHEVNTVRKHVTATGGGQLARAAAPAPVVTLVLSDVVGDDLEVIASGPTVGDPTTFADARRVLEARGLWERADLPAAVRRHLEAGLSGEVPETPKPGDPVVSAGPVVLVGSNAQALEAAREDAEERGYATLVLSSRLQGEARELAFVHAALIEELRADGRPLAPPACVLLGGEPTVTLRGGGKGGRSQELALAAAARIAGVEGAVLLAAGTDGTDGPTDAAGALVDGGTVSRGAQRGLDAEECLRRNDAYAFLEASGDLLFTGPTGTNVMDLHVILVGARASG